MKEQAVVHRIFLVRIFFLILKVLLPLVGGLLLFLYWQGFHPSDVTMVVGPAGSKHRAFIEQRGFLDISLVACVSDWPYTIGEPYLLASVDFPEAYSDEELFWSRDGSVLAFRVVRRGEKEKVYEAAFDFREHLALKSERKKIETLIEERGGVGPEFTRYPDPTKNVY